ncbi:Cytochrome P450 7B1 [Tulasnella sp. 403]|nr:Cytochrome P450 7B1 [Tulasnella sp. 403]
MVVPSEAVNVPLIVATIAIAAILLGYQRSISKKASGRPPVVPYWIPWLGSAIELGKDPDGFFRKARECHGDLFGVQAAGKFHYYLNSESAINIIYKNSKSFVFTPTRLSIAVSVFGISHDVAYSGWLEMALYPMHHRILSPACVPPLVESLVKHGIRLLHEQREAMQGDVVHTTLEEFVQKFTFRTIAAAFFGRSFPADEASGLCNSFDYSRVLTPFDNQAYKPFMTFDDYFPLLIAEMPSFVTSKGVRARDKLIGMFETYLNQPSWSEDAAEMMKEMVDLAQAASPPLSSWDTAVMLNSDLWAAEGNMSWGFFWSLSYPLHNPHTLQPLLDELHASIAEFQSSNPSADLTNNPSDLLTFLTNTPFPLITSYVNEALRLSSSSFSIRTVEEDGACVGGYTFERGDKVVCATRSIHLDEDVYPDPYVFKGDRFLGSNVVEGGGKKPYLAFGGGISQCEGRHFAIRGIKALFALMLLHFDIQLDPSKPSRIEFDMSRIGAGILHPAKHTHIVVKKRKLL